MPAAAFKDKRFTQVDLVAAERAVIVRVARHILRVKGCSLSEVSRLIGVPVATLWRHVEAWNRGGRRALRTQFHKSGRKPASRR